MLSPNKHTTIHTTNIHLHQTRYEVCQGRFATNQSMTSLSDDHCPKAPSFSQNCGRVPPFVFISDTQKFGLSN